MATTSRACSPLAQPKWGLTAALPACVLQADSSQHAAI
jgi:hypothetical protein